MEKIILFTCLLLGNLMVINAQSAQSDIEIWDLYETEISNSKNYNNPYMDVELKVEIISPDKKVLFHYGFYDGNNIWKIRFSPDKTGNWKYKAYFSDDSVEKEGSFKCVSTDKPGRVVNDKYNSFWLGRSNVSNYLFRSFHVGDRFFAENWDDPNNPDDGEKRSLFLNWLWENGYNMLSIASFFTNRDSEGRGRGWDTPQLWPLDFMEYRKMEQILDTLKVLDITVFPFAGFFGEQAQWPVDHKEQELYIKYILARIGHYPNIILNIAGPEPFFKSIIDRDRYKGAMRRIDINRIGSLIDSLDIHDNVITLHRMKSASQFGDSFIDESWCDMSTLQGPTTRDHEELFSRLNMNHHRYKSQYAQETLWPGNKNHPGYTKEEIRRNMLTVLFSGSVLCYADMEGNSSSGFSGSLDLNDVVPWKHEIATEVWDWFETIPFHQMTTRQELVNSVGYCLAKEGVEYYVYAPEEKSFNLYLDFPYELQTEWINASNFTETRKGPSVNSTTRLKTPDDGEDWILHVYAPKVKMVATGHFPDLTTDNNGNIHLIYNRNGLKYKKYDRSTQTWSDEESTGCVCENIFRSDPDIVVDSKGNPHVFCGSEYARFNGEKWEKIVPSATRDTELAIDSKDNVYLVSRAGYNGGYIGFEKINWSEYEWIKMTDPDKNSKGENDHVYTDIFIDDLDIIHLVQRHGPEVEVTYRQSADDGKTWPVEENVMDEREEAPHIVATSKGVPFITTGAGYVLERTGKDNWKQHGRKVEVHSRMQPELGIDSEDNIYVTSFGGHYNIFYKGYWIGEKKILPVTKNGSVGFVETAGLNDFVYVVWEEGSGNADKGLEENAKIMVGIMYPDGRIVGLF